MCSAERLSQLWVHGRLIDESNPRAPVLAVAGAWMPLCRWQAGADHPLWTKPVGSRPGSQATPGWLALTTSAGCSGHQLSVWPMTLAPCTSPLAVQSVDGLPVMCNALAPCPSYPTLQPPISRSVSDSPSPSSIERMVSSRCQAGSTSRAALLGQVVNPRVCARGHPMDLAEVRVGWSGRVGNFSVLKQHEQR